MRIPLLLLTLCLAIACNRQKPQTLEEKNLKEEPAQQAFVEDTTVYDMPYKTAELKDANDYFKKNNRYKDWDVNNRQTILVRAIIEKDSIASGIKILSKNIEHLELKEEAMRLIQDAKIAPALNEEGEAVRSKWTIAVYFPPH